MSAGYGDDDDNESSGESEVDDGKIQNRPETPPADDVVVPPPRKVLLDWISKNNLNWKVGGNMGNIVKISGKFYRKN